ncbi:MAG: GAF domain-containing protein [Spirochaetales bacterium]
MTDYALLTAQLASLIEGEPDLIANLANAAALLNSEVEGLNWVGFYLVKGDQLVLGPFQGLPACIRLPYGKGVCGSSWRRGESVRVDDVHTFPGHIACDSASLSELVIPLFDSGVVWGVLDLDSPRLARFSEHDQAGLETFCRVLEDGLKRP